MSQITKTRFTKTMNKHMNFCKLRVIFQTNNRIKNYFYFKEFVPETLRSRLIYKISWESCTASYNGKTYRHFKVRVSEHQGVSPRRGKPVKGTSSTSVTDNMLVCDHYLVHEDFKFLSNESNRYFLELKEISHHLIATYTSRSYYCFEYSILDNFFYLTLLQILLSLYQLLKYQDIFQLFLCHSVNGVNLKMGAVSSGSLFKKQTLDMSINL